MGKAPAFQFYVRDWLADPALRLASHSTRGIWIDFLCYMWESDERGVIAGTKEQLMKMVGSTVEDMDKFLTEAALLKFATVTECHKIITVRNRRMEREHKDKTNNAIRQARHRESQKSNAEITPLSSSSSSSSSSTASKKIDNKHQYGSLSNVLLTDAEMERLRDEFGEDALSAIEYLSTYKAEKGYKTKSDNLTIRRWVIDAVQKRKGQNGKRPDPTQSSLYAETRRGVL